MSNISVHTSGAVISSLQYEHSNADSNQEGFLLGHIEEMSKESINDREINMLQTKIVINVTGFVSCSSYGEFYSGSGKIKLDRLKHFISDKEQKVVGWYHYRSYSSKIFLREYLVHEQLKTIMEHVGDRFIFAVISRLIDSQLGVLDVSYRFQVMTQSKEFETVPLSVVNAKDTSFNQYILDLSHDAFYNSSEIFGQNSTNIKEIEPGVVQMQEIHNNILLKLKDLLPKYSDIQKRHKKILEKVVTYRQLCCYHAGYSPGFNKNFAVSDFKNANQNGQTSKESLSSFPQGKPIASCPDRPRNSSLNNSREIFADKSNSSSNNIEENVLPHSENDNAFVN